MKFLGLWVLLMSTAFAQVPNHQCPVAGTRLSSEYVGLAGETVSKAWVRNGTDSIPTTAEMVGNLTAKTFRVFRESHCVARSYSYQERVCSNVPLDIALGRGNNNFKSFYDLHLSLLRRAELFNNLVRFGTGMSGADRLNISNEIVKNLTRIAVNTGIPNSWEEFTAALDQILKDGFLSFQIFEDITKLNVDHNRRQLGFLPLPGVEIREERGNGKLERMFDLNMSSQHRSAFIQRNIQGVNPRTADALSVSFIDFAAVNGIPKTWNQFLLLMKFSLDKGALTPDTHRKITVTLEVENRASLGFEQSAVSCKLEVRQRMVNRVEETSRREFKADVSKNYKINITNAPLLSGEKENFEVSFNGINELEISAAESFNSYRITERKDVNGVEQIKVLGTRKQVTPPNHIHAEILHSGKTLNVRLRNDAFNPLIGGKILVQVDFYEVVALWSDRKLATHTFELTNGELTTFNPNVQMKKGNRKGRVDVSVKYVGSPYYNQSFSAKKEFKEKR